MRAFRFALVLLALASTALGQNLDRLKRRRWPLFTSLMLVVGLHSSPQQMEPL
jgi:hypothetical protein